MVIFVLLKKVFLKCPPLNVQNCNSRIICRTRNLTTKSVNRLSIVRYSPVNSDMFPNLSSSTLTFSYSLSFTLPLWSLQHESGLMRKFWTRPSVPINEGSEGKRKRKTEREKQRVKEGDRSYTICLKVSAIFQGALHHPPVFSSSITPQRQDWCKHLTRSTLTLGLHCCHS